MTDHDPSPKAMEAARPLWHGIAGGDIDTIEEVAHALDAFAAAAVAREREACCADVCSYCETGEPLVGWHHILHPDCDDLPGECLSPPQECEAWAIRARSVSL